MIEEQLVMQVSGSPTIGGLRIGMRQDRSAPVMELVTPTPMDERLLLELQQVTAELRGLRADLASRTLAARLTRAWDWLLSLFA